MKKITLSLLILFLFTLSSIAQNIRGIYVESPCERVVLYVNNERVCNPVESCMISNLSAGNYLVEAFAIGSRGRYDRLVYSERIYFDGRGVINVEFEDTFVDIMSQYSIHRIVDTKKIYCKSMDTIDFNNFISAIKKANFRSDKLELIELAADETYLKVEQLISIMNLFTFDDEKMTVFKSLYPNVVDKENSYNLLEEISFYTNKTKMKEFIKKYSNRR